MRSAIVAALAAVLAVSPMMTPTAELVVPVLIDN